MALMPHSDTDLNVGYIMHHGINKGAIPKNWGMVDKVKYKVVTQSFVQYLETCYSMSRSFLPSWLIANDIAIAKEEREAQSLPQADIHMPSNETNFDVPNEAPPLPEGDVADSLKTLIQAFAK